MANLIFKYRISIDTIFCLSNILLDSYSFNLKTIFSKVF
jgi:hypothetical protein